MTEWNRDQLGVFEDFRTGEGSTAVDAVPGGGKSTTAIGSLAHLPEKGAGNVLVTSFGTQSIDDLKAKAAKADVPWSVDIRTMNSLGNRAITQEYGSQKVSKDRVWGVLDETLGQAPEDRAQRGSFNGFRTRIKALVDFAKNNLVSGVGPLMDLADAYDIETAPPEWMRDKLSDMYEVPWESSIAAAANVALEECKKITGSIDFNDQLWLPVVLNLEVEKFNRIVVDEGQDTSLVQVELLHRSMRKGARMFLYGDDFQAIYGWRGAGQGMAPLVKKTNAKRMPLSVSYRCPRLIVKEAKALNPSMESAPGAIEGYVGSITKDMLVNKLVAGDTVLSRKNAPLVSLFLRCLHDGVPVGMRGNDIGHALLSFIDKSQRDTAEGLLKFTAEWSQEEIKRRLARNPNANVDRIHDHVECIDALCAETSSIKVVRQRVNDMLLTPPASKVLLSSVHRAKGLEFPRVFILEDTFPVKPSFWLTHASQKKGNVNEWCAKRAADVMEKEIEERNILYVAITRAQQELIYVR